MNFFKSIPRLFLLSVLSGIMIGTSYIPFQGWALLFCYSPLWIAVLSIANGEKSFSQKIKYTFALGWLTQFVLTLIGFNWIYYVSSEFGLLHWSLSLGALLLFAAFMHIYIPLSLVIASIIIEKIKIKNQLVQLLMLAFMLSFLERIWPSIFEWNLAYSLLWMKWPLFQWADTVGFWGLSTWILLIQAFISYGLLYFKSDRRKCLETIGITLTVIVILNILGFMKVEYRYA